MKKMRFLLYFVCMAVILTVPAWAYVDPSVTTFALQAVAAVVVAAGAVIGVVWRKAKKKAMKVLNIDENAGKTVEDDLVVFPEGEQQAEASGEAQTGAVPAEAAEAAAEEQAVAEQTADTAAE